MTTMMWSAHLLPAGAVIDSYSPPTNPDQSEDGIIQIDTAEDYRCRCQIQYKRALMQRIKDLETELQAARWELWQAENPGKDWLLDILYS